MVIEPVDDDPDRQYSEPEKDTLTRNLIRLTEQVRKVDSKSQQYSVALICSWHKQLFDGVRNHAGRYRSASFGEDRLTFGPHRSFARADVPGALNQHVRQATELLDQLVALDGRQEKTEFVRSILKASLYVHADLIWIHPFRDGNGRVSRLCITYYLCKFGLPPIVFEVLRQEYIDHLHHYYVTDELEPLIKLALRIYNNQH